MKDEQFILYFQALHELDELMEQEPDRAKENLLRIFSRYPSLSDKYREKLKKQIKLMPWKAYD